MVIMFFPFEKQEKKVALSGTDTHQRLILLLRLVKFNRSRNLIWIYITFLLPCQPCQHWIATRDRSAHVLQDQHVHTRCRRRRVYKMRLRFKNSWGDAAGIISSLIDIKWRAVTRYIRSSFAGSIFLIHQPGQGSIIFQPRNSSQPKTLYFLVLYTMMPYNSVLFLFVFFRLSLAASCAWIAF
jgi:hypothetical protein